MNHGDVYTPNVVFSVNTNGDVGNDLLAIIDWQLARPGSCMDDIALVKLQYC